MGFPHLSPALEESEPSAHLHLHETPALYKPSKGEGLEAYGMALGLCPSLLALSLFLILFDLRQAFQISASFWLPPLKRTAGRRKVQRLFLAEADLFTH